MIRQPSEETVLNALIRGRVMIRWKDLNCFTPFLVARKGAQTEHPYNKIGSTAEWKRNFSLLLS
jgi:hypothetical protein